ncbi:hypothetical protein TanjilG_20987 [Lupinus angustifolius]|uniref:F-box domain-containing protein n=1 Tax=Lupinus angustifolius TaxID=3871 RepID=A0A1J7H9C5_LUPAN|nr:PREDICTED: F-box/LRR-repeat protein 4-like [Lupinus angustifolius]OIW09390.1 hypothetical protein TanjilG_20987 [Lupinus angustifolius]
MDNILCDELLEEIFLKLPPSSSLSLVSKRWLHLHRSSTTSLSLSLSPLSSIPPSLSSLLHHHPSLSSLSLRLSPPPTAATTAAFAFSSNLLSLVSSCCVNLRSLAFHVGPVSLSSLTSLSKACTFLNSLSVTLPRRVFLKWVLCFPSLKHLSIEFHEVEVESQHGVLESYNFDEDDGDDGEFELGLESVCFVGINGDDYGVGWLWRRCKKLKRLKLQRCQGIGGSYSCFVQCLKSIEEVEIRTCRVVADGILFKLAENCYSLKSLLLYDGGGSREGLLYFFSQCRSNLNKLDLRLPMDLDNNHIQSVAMNFRCITSLRLQSCYLLSGEGLKAVGLVMSNVLEELALINCDVVGSESGLLATLGQHLRKLRKLDLSHNEMLLDKELISMLVSCVHLIDLRLRGCKRLTSVAMVSMLRSCKRLENVDIMNCFGIESESIEMLVKKSPRLRRIEVEGNKISDAARMWASNRFIEVIA